MTHPCIAFNLIVFKNYCIFIQYSVSGIIFAFKHIELNFNNQCRITQSHNDWFTMCYRYTFLTFKMLLDKMQGLTCNNHTTFVFSSLDNRTLYTLLSHVGEAVGKRVYPASGRLGVQIPAATVLSRKFYTDSDSSLPNEL